MAVIYTRALGALSRAVLFAVLLVATHAALRVAPSEAAAKDGIRPGVPFAEVLGLQRAAAAGNTSGDGGRGAGRGKVGFGWMRLRRRWGRAGGRPGGRGAAAPHPDPRRLFRELSAGGRALAAAAGDAAWAGAAAGWRSALAWLRPPPRHSGALGGGGSMRLW